jgi:hypothetical protein
MLNELSESAQVDVADAWIRPWTPNGVIRRKVAGAFGESSGTMGTLAADLGG